MKFVRLVGDLRFGCVGKDRGALSEERKLTTVSTIDDALPTFVQVNRQGSCQQYYMPPNTLTY